MRRAHLRQSEDELITSSGGALSVLIKAAWATRDSFANPAATALDNRDSGKR